MISNLMMDRKKSILRISQSQNRPIYLLGRKYHPSLPMKVSAKSWERYTQRRRELMIKGDYNHFDNDNGDSCDDYAD